MAAGGVELATAWVRLAYTSQNISGQIATQMAPAAAIAKTEGDKAGKGFAGGFAKNLKGVGVALGVAFGVNTVVNFLKDSAQAVKEWQVINAQSAAVVKSTGGVANVTATQIHDLAQSIEGTTATQAESIQKGANMLLTFKNIRNEVGAGNDIFNQSTQALVDMARATGTDAAAASVKLGKALNDPIAGISSLSRVGVQFTQDQKDQIKTLVESGQTLDAQKIILKELNDQFGGSGAAYAETAAGKMYLFSDAVGDLGEKLMVAFLPALTEMAVVGAVAFGWITDNLPLVGAFTAAILLSVIAVQAHSAAMAVAAAGGVVKWLAATKLAAAAQWLLNAAMTANPIGLVIAAIAALVAGLVWFFTQTELGQQVWKNVTDFIASAVKWLWEVALKPVFDALAVAWGWVVDYFTFQAKLMANAVLWLWFNGIKPAIDWIVGAFNRGRDNIVSVISVVITTIKTIKGVVDDVLGNVGRAFEQAFKNVINFVAGPVNAIKDVITGLGKIKIPFIGGDAPGQWRGTDLGGGGAALQRVKSVLPAGLRVTSTYRTPEQNRQVGGVPGSLHTNKANPAVDIAGPKHLMDAFAQRLAAMGGWRQLLWQVPGHYDHIHVAHSGGTVASSWPRSPGDGPNERTARLEVGEVVVPKGEADRVQAVRAFTAVEPRDDGENNGSTFEFVGDEGGLFALFDVWERKADGTRRQIISKGKKVGG